MKKHRTLMIAAIAAGLLLLAGGILIFGFRLMKQQNLNEVVSVEETTEDIVVTEDSGEATADTTVDMNVRAPETEKEFVEQMKSEGIEIVNSFTNGGISFLEIPDEEYHSRKTEEIITGEDAANIMLTEVERVFPDTTLSDYYYMIFINYDDKSVYGARKIWVIIGDSKRQTARIDAVTGQIETLVMPGEKTLYHNVGTEKVNQEGPWMSTLDFLQMMNDDAWGSEGLRLIRQNKLDGGEVVLKDLRVDYGKTYGVVEVTATYKKDGIPTDIWVTLDLKSRELVGYGYRAAEA